MHSIEAQKHVDAIHGRVGRKGIDATALEPRQAVQGNLALNRLAQGAGTPPRRPKKEGAPPTPSSTGLVTELLYGHLALGPLKEPKDQRHGHRNFCPFEGSINNNKGAASGKNRRYADPYSRQCRQQGNGNHPNS